MPVKQQFIPLTVSQYELERERRRLLTHLCDSDLVNVNQADQQTVGQFDSTCNSAFSSLLTCLDTAKAGGKLHPDTLRAHNYYTAQPCPNLELRRQILDHAVSDSVTALVSNSRTAYGDERWKEHVERAKESDYAWFSPKIILDTAADMLNIEIVVLSQSGEPANVKPPTLENGCQVFLGHYKGGANHYYLPLHPSGRRCQQAVSEEPEPPIQYVTPNTQSAYGDLHRILKTLLPSDSIHARLSGIEILAAVQQNAPTLQDELLQMMASDKTHVRVIAGGHSLVAAEYEVRFENGEGELGPWNSLIKPQPLGRSDNIVANRKRKRLFENTTQWWKNAKLQPEKKRLKQKVDTYETDPEEFKINVIREDKLLQKKLKNRSLMPVHRWSAEDEECLREYRCWLENSHNDAVVQFGQSKVPKATIHNYSSHIRRLHTHLNPESYGPVVDAPDGVHLKDMLAPGEFQLTADHIKSYVKEASENGSFNPAELTKAALCGMKSWLTYVIYCVGKLDSSDQTEELIEHLKKVLTSVVPKGKLQSLKQKSAKNTTRHLQTLKAADPKVRDRVGDAQNAFHQYMASPGYADFQNSVHARCDRRSSSGGACMHQVCKLAVCSSSYELACNVQVRSVRRGINIRTLTMSSWARRSYIYSKSDCGDDPKPEDLMKRNLGEDGNVVGDPTIVGGDIVWRGCVLTWDRDKVETGSLKEHIFVPADLVLLIQENSIHKAEVWGDDAANAPTAPLFPNLSNGFLTELKPEQILIKALGPGMSHIKSASFRKVSRTRGQNSGPLKEFEPMVSNSSNHEFVTRYQQDKEEHVAAAVMRIDRDYRNNLPDSTRPLSEDARQNVSVGQRDREGAQAMLAEIHETKEELQKRNPQRFLLDKEKQLLFDLVEWGKEQGAEDPGGPFGRIVNWVDVRVPPLVEFAPDWYRLLLGCKNPLGEKVRQAVVDSYHGNPDTNSGRKSIEKTKANRPWCVPDKPSRVTLLAYTYGLEPLKARNKLLRKSMKGKPPVIFSHSDIDLRDTMNNMIEGNPRSDSESDPDDPDDVGSGAEPDCETDNNSGDHPFVSSFIRMPSGQIKKRKTK